MGVTRRELLEADGYRRRRLVAALVGGAAPSPEEEARRGAVLLGGLALALLLVGGVAVRGLVSPGAPHWDGAPGLVIVPETGERYLVAEQGGPLQPVANLSSAQLVLGADITPTLVPAQALVGHQHGPEVGIAGAPQRLPTRGELVESGWSACTADGAGVSYALSRDPAPVTAIGRGALVSADGVGTWVVAMDAQGRAWRYSVPTGGAGTALLVATGLPPTSQAVRVPVGWLALVPSGGALTADTWVRAGWSGPALLPLAATLCAQLGTRAGAPPSIRLATLAPDATWVAPPAGTVVPVVAPGGGAVASSTGRRWIVDDRGRADPIDDRSLEALGFDPEVAVAVPRGWLTLLGTGPPLSRDSALRPPAWTSG